MKEKQTENFKYIKKNIIVGDKSRTIITINKKPQSESKVISSSVKKAVDNNRKNTKTSIRKKCSGCSRKRRG